MKKAAGILAVALISAPCAHAGFGFVLATRPSAAPLTPYVPDIRYQHNSSGRENSVIRYWAGYYEVRMPLVMQVFREGNVQVSAYGSGNAYCKTRLWRRVANVDLSVIVECYRPSGEPVDSQFTVLYHDEQLDPDRLAFMFLDRPSPSTWTFDHGYEPPAARRHNARSPGDPGGDLWVNWTETLGTGRYRVFIHGWTANEASYLVTATGGSKARCTIEDEWFESAWVTTGRYTVSRMVAIVACVRPDGTPQESSFSLAYANRRPFGNIRGGIGAYLLADRPTATDSYLTPADHSWNARSASNSVQRAGVGVYIARMPELAGRYSKSTALVTARDSDGKHCKVGFWLAPAPDVRVAVTCFAPSGAPADTAFFLQFITDGV